MKFSLIPFIYDCRKNILGFYLFERKSLRCDSKRNNTCILSEGDFVDK